MRQLFSNLAGSTLASSITAEQTEITAVDGSPFQTPTGGDFEVLFLGGTPSTPEYEIIRLTGRVGDVLTVARGQEGTTAQAFAAGVAIQARDSAETFRRLQNATGGDSYTVQIGEGANASVADAIAIGRSTTATTGEAVAVGYSADATGTQAVAVGSGAQSTGAQSVAVGVGANASAEKSVAAGFGAEAAGLGSVATGNGAKALGIGAISIGSITVNVDYGVAIGRATVTGAGAVGIGSDFTTASGQESFACMNGTSSGLASFAAGGTASGLGAVAFSGTAAGMGSVALNPYWGSRAGPTGAGVFAIQVIPRGDQSAAGEEIHAYPGAQVAFSTDEIDLTSIYTHTFNIPATCKFFPDRVDIILTEVAALTALPTLSVTGLVASHQISGLAAVGDRIKFDALDSSAGRTSIVADITTGATATTLKGRFVFVGLLIEDEA